MKKAWFWLKLALVLIIFALILPPAIAWVRHLMFSAATAPPVEDVLTPAGQTYGRAANTLLGRVVEVLRSYYRGP
jgi:Ca2+/H+ antiporter